MSSKPDRKRLEFENIRDITVVNFVDQKIENEHQIQLIGEQLFSLVDEGGRRKILLNFQNVTYMSSLALQKLITLNKKVFAVAGRLVLCNMKPSIYEVFEITKLHKDFNIVPEGQHAMEAFHKN